MKKCLLLFFTIIFYIPINAQLVQENIPTYETITACDSIIIDGNTYFENGIYYSSQIGLDINGESEVDMSGNSISLSSDGKTLAIASINNDVNGINSGHVRVYKWDGENWYKLGDNIDGESADDNFGYSVSLSSNGNILAVGSPYVDEIASNSGQVKIFSWDGNS